MSKAFSLLFALPGFVLCMLASGEVDVAAGNEELVELRRLAEQGDAEAQSSLAVMYDTGEGVPEDDAEAVKWFRMAAEQGATQSNLGVMYAARRARRCRSRQVVPHGSRVTPLRNPTWVSCTTPAKDDAEAVKWFRMAAEQGNADAQYNLGVMYDTGEGRARRRCRSRQVVPHGCRAG